MRRRWLRILGTLVVLVAIGLAIKYAMRTEEIPVTIFRVARGTVEETVTNSKAGTVETRKRAKLSPEVGGRVAELNAREGDRVTEGQVLLRLADADFRARVNLQQRSLNSARAVTREACLTAEQAEREYRRYQRLADDDIVSEELVEQQESQRNVTAAACEAAQAAEQEAESALELARVDLTKTELRAPFDGIVAEVEIEVGEWITPSPPALPVPAVVELIQDTATYVSAPLDEVDLDKVREGQQVRVTLDAYPGRSFAGTVVRVAPYVTDFEEYSRTFEIEVELQDQDFATRLRPGTSADVEVILTSRSDVLRIPSYALIEGDRVFIVNAGKIVAREVDTGIRNWDFTEISRGLDEGEQVVVSVDRIEIEEGAKVRIADETLK
jgi:HlyD family secretion protein